MTEDDDIRDAMLFRFWCRAAQFPKGYPIELSAAFTRCKTADDYRKALTELALKKGVNIP